MSCVQSAPTWTVAHARYVRSLSRCLWQRLVRSLCAWLFGELPYVQQLRATNPHARPVQCVHILCGIPLV